MNEWEHGDEFTFPNHPLFFLERQCSFYSLIACFYGHKTVFHCLPPPFLARRNSHGLSSAVVGRESDSDAESNDRNEALVSIKSSSSAFPPLSPPLLISIGWRHGDRTQGISLSKAEDFTVGLLHHLPQLDVQFPAPRKTGRGARFQYATVISAANSPASV